MAWSKVKPPSSSRIISFSASSSSSKESLFETVTHKSSRRKLTVNMKSKKPSSPRNNKITPRARINGHASPLEVNQMKKKTADDDKTKKKRSQQKEFINQNGTLHPIKERQIKFSPDEDYKRYQKKFELCPVSIFAVDLVHNDAFVPHPDNKRKRFGSILPKVKWDEEKIKATRALEKRCIEKMVRTLDLVVDGYSVERSANKPNAVPATKSQPNSKFNQKTRPQPQQGLQNGEVRRTTSKRPATSSKASPTKKMKSEDEGVCIGDGDSDLIEDVEASLDTADKEIARIFRKILRSRGKPVEYPAEPEDLDYSDNEENVEQAQDKIIENNRQLNFHCAQKLAWWFLKAQVDPPEEGIFHPELRDVNWSEICCYTDEDPDLLFNNLEKERIEFCSPAKGRKRDPFYGEDVLDPRTISMRKIRMDRKGNFEPILKATKIDRTTGKVKEVTCNICWVSFPLERAGTHMGLQSHKNNFNLSTFKLVQNKQETLGQVRIPASNFPAKLLEPKVRLVMKSEVMDLDLDDSEVD